jgi:hypothetical protein
MSASFLLACSLTFTMLFGTRSCQKDEKYMTDAILTGYDARSCACCGGLMVTFNGETQPYSGDFMLIENTDAIGISSTDRFPIYVELDWTSDSTKCFGNYITVTRIRKQ